MELIILLYILPMLLCLATIGERLYLKSKGVVINEDDDFFQKHLLIAFTPLANIEYLIKLAKILYQELKK